MKETVTILCLTAATLLSGCVTRTTTTEKGFGGDVTETKTIWIWQSEFYDK